MLSGIWRRGGFMRRLDVFGIVFGIHLLKVEPESRYRAELHSLSHDTALSSIAESLQCIVLVDKNGKQKM